MVLSTQYSGLSKPPFTLFSGCTLLPEYEYFHKPRGVPLGASFEYLAAEPVLTTIPDEYGEYIGNCKEHYIKNQKIPLK